MKLQTVDTIADNVSTFVPHILVFITVSIFLVFANIGAAFWLGVLLGSIFLGFFAVAVFYGLVAFILYFFMRKGIKRNMYDYIIKQLLK